MGFFKNRFNKEGPGVSKDKQEKRRFFLFFEVYGRNIWKIITVNLLFVLCSIPIVTIGPALTGKYHVLRNLSKEEQSFVSSDFFEHFKKNLKQGIPAGIFSILTTIILFIANVYYYSLLSASIMYFILFVLTLIVDILFIFAHFYIYLMIVTVDLKLTDIYKNAFIFAIIGLKNNVITFAAILLLLFILNFVPIPILLLLYILIIPATIGFIISFNCFPIIQKYSIDPYYEKNEDEVKDSEAENIESIFSDKRILPEDNNAKKDKVSKTEL